MSILWADDTAEAQARYDAWKKLLAEADQKIRNIESDLEMARVDVSVNEDRLEDARTALLNGDDVAANEIELIKASLAEARADVDDCTRWLDDAQGAYNALSAQKERLPEHVERRLNAVGLREFFVATAVRP